MTYEGFLVTISATEKSFGMADFPDLPGDGVSTAVIQLRVKRTSEESDWVKTCTSPRLGELKYLPIYKPRRSLGKPDSSVPQPTGVAALEKEGKKRSSTAIVEDTEDGAFLMEVRKCDDSVVGAVRLDATMTTGNGKIYYPRIDLTEGWSFRLGEQEVPLEYSAKEIAKRNKQARRAEKKSASREELKEKSRAKSLEDSKRRVQELCRKAQKRGDEKGIETFCVF